MDVYLIVADALRRLVYRRYLHGLGYRVMVVDFAFPEQSVSQPGIPDAVIADFSGSGRHPIAMLAALNEQFPGIPLILLLGREQDLTADEAMGFGAKAILRDPVLLEDLGLHLAVSIEGFTAKRHEYERGLMCR